jgi:LysM repeat protein
MALNLKAALGICLFFIAGLCYVVNRVALPSEAAATQAIGLAENSSARPGDSSSLGARRLARQNPVDSQRAAGREAAAKAVADATPPETRTVVLPPLARSEAPVSAAVMLVAEGPAKEPALPAPGRPAEPSASGARVAGRVLEGSDQSAGENKPLNQRPGNLAAAEPPAAAAPEPVRGAAPAEPAVAGAYKVKKGDSLARVARQVFGSSDQRYVRMLVEANPKISKRTNKLFVGEELTVPALASAAAKTATPAAEPKPAPAAPLADAVAQKSVKPGKKGTAVAERTSKASDSVATAEPAGSKAPTASAVEPARVGAEAKAASAAAPAPVTAAGKTAKPGGKKGTAVAEKRSKATDTAAGTSFAAAEPSGKKSVASGAKSNKPAEQAAAETVAQKTAKFGKKGGKGGETAAAQWYTIRSSDSLASIARDLLKDGRRWRELADVNGLRDPNKIVPGKRIKLPAGAQPQS